MLTLLRVQGLEGYDRYFAMARGVEDIGAMDMSKYFDANYHYLMPELDGSSTPSPNFAPFLDKVGQLLVCAIMNQLLLCMVVRQLLAASAMSVTSQGCLP